MDPCAVTERVVTKNFPYTGKPLNMDNLIENFPALNDLPVFHAFVSAVHAKEKEQGITVRKLRDWLGQYGKVKSEMLPIREILFTDPTWKKDVRWRRRLMMLVTTGSLTLHPAILPCSRTPPHLVQVRALKRDAESASLPDANDDLVVTDSHCPSERGASAPMMVRATEPDGAGPVRGAEAGRQEWNQHTGSLSDQAVEVLQGAQQIFERVYLQQGAMTVTKAKALIRVALLYCSRRLFGADRANEERIIQHFPVSTSLLNRAFTQMAAVTLPKRSGDAVA